MSPKSKKDTTRAESADFHKLKDLLQAAKRVLISTHVLPDGDGLGAETALYHYLKRSKKSCRVYNPDPVPRRYRFLDPQGKFLHGPTEVELWDQWDLWIIVDTNDPRRLGKLWPELSLRARRIVFLDHHPDLLGGAEVTYPPHASLVSDVGSSSIGELLYRLFSNLNLTKLNQDIALGLYVSVMTDTNSFRYARTTALAHYIAGEMIDLGVNPEEVYQAIYSSKELSHLHLLGNMLQNVKTSHNGKIAWLELRLDLRKKHLASADDTQSFLSLLLLLKSAEIVCLFREEDDHAVRVSIKSKGKIIVNKVAMELGGGGHDYAAGLALSLSMEKTVDAVVRRLGDLVSHAQRFG